METPFTDHLTNKDFEYVYKPSEDSFLLLDALEKDLDFIESLNPLVCLEIGSGSGVIITALSKRLHSTICLATDINPMACIATKKTSEYNKGSVDVLNTCFTNCLKNNSIDLLVFNPPYVQTSDDELSTLSINCNNDSSSLQSDVTAKDLVRTWAGGIDGREIINQIINLLPSILKQNGVFYLLALKENKPYEIIENLEIQGFNGEIFLDRRIPGEHLFIIKIMYKN